MKRFLYIGIYSEGSTSKMRADKLIKMLDGWECKVIDTNIPKQSCNKFWQSLGFRKKIGPVIWRVNKYVLGRLEHEHYDLIWVDKAIYLTQKTTGILRDKTDKLVHFSPDPAFKFHRSHHFEKSAQIYDYLITTKSFELDDYVNAAGAKEKVLFATQGYDKNIHRPLVAWKDKHGLVFIGHAEEGRKHTLQQLLNAGLDVTLAGIEWDGFAERNKGNPHLNYLGQGVFGEDYVKAICSGLFAWGSVSKWIPEKHTTRTFEIPACKTALVTERNEELLGFFSDEEVIYYADEQDMVSRIVYYDQHRDELKAIIEAGYKAVTEGGYDYESIIKHLLDKVLENGKYRS